MTAPIDDIYPLSAAQTGMLFHTLLEPGAGLYVEQIVFTFDGPLEPERFERAWQRVVERHAALRTSFAWNGLEEPMQVVQRWVTVPFQQYDWRGQSASGQETRLTAFLRDDRRVGFDLSAAPLMRFAVCLLADDRYTLVWTHHHILLDGWSVPIVLEEVFAFYRASLQSRDLVLPPAPSYRDYVAWLLQQDPEPARAFWRRALDGFTTPTPLPIERRTPLPLFPEYSSTETVLTDETTIALRESARAMKVTLNTLAQGAWGLLLARYSDSADVVFGAIVAGRPATLPGVEETVGMFINTLPVRVRVPADAVVGPWLQALQREQSAARRFEHSPLAEVQQYAGIPSDRQLFDSVFAFENYPTIEPRGSAANRPARSEPPALKRAEGLRLRDIRSFTKTNYPLNIVIIDGDRLRVKIVYDEGRFEPDAMERMLGHLTTLLIEIATHPERPVASLQMLSAAERNQVLVDWNRTERPFPSHMTLPELFDAQATRAPDALAVAAGGTEVSYAALRSRANRLAAGLRALGVRPDVAVAVCLRRSVEQIAGVLGIVKAGGAYVPLDPDHPPARLEAMVIESGARILLTDASGRDRLRGLAPTVDIRRVGVDWPDGGWLDTDPDVVGGLTADHLAYVIFTSGSTGTPNGVAVSHRAVVNLLTWHRAAYDVTPSDRATQLASPGFDASVWELWPYLTAGASIHIPPEEVLLSPRLLIAWLADAGITLSFLPTPLAELIVNADGRWPPHLALRVLLTGGDVLRRRPREQLPFRLVNHYGPTESTVVATAGPVDAADADDRPSIGRPIANTKVYVLDSSLQPVPVLVPGELCIGGAGLARGYLNNPKLTLHKFVADPHAGTGGGRLYRTGDVARFLPNGDIEFLGRRDGQVKIRGTRIELAEVERIIAHHPGLQSVVVTLQHDASGEAYLVAYFVAAGPTPSEDELRRFAREHLPASMVPMAFEAVESLPLTPNGKIDRRALPAPSFLSRPGRDRATPQGDIERAIARSWEEVLHVDAVGVTDNFFDLGGHSLLIFRLHSKLCETLGRELALMDLFTYPTVRSLAAFVQGDRPDRRAAEDVASRAASQRRAFASRSRVMAGRRLGND